MDFDQGPLRPASAPVATSKRFRHPLAAAFDVLVMGKRCRHFQFQFLSPPVPMVPITATLLPSLQAQYQMEQVVSAEVMGSEAKFDIDLPRHSLSFTTKLQITEISLRRPRSNCLKSTSARNACRTASRRKNLWTEWPSVQATT